MLDQIKFVLITSDGDKIAGKIELPDQVAIERNFDCSILHLFTDSSHTAERLAYGAWHSLRRKKQIPDTTEFDPFLNTLAELKDSVGDPDLFEEPEVPKAEDKARLSAAQ